MKEIDEILERLQRDELRYEELRMLLDHSAALVRANAMNNIGERFRGYVTAAEDLQMASRQPNNAVTLMGTISVAHIAVANFARVVEDEKRTRELIEEWPEPGKADLIWFLKSENLFSGETRKHDMK